MLKDVPYNLAFHAELPGETVPGQPIAELIGDNRVFIENHKGVCAYCCNKITVRVSFGQLCVFGTDLMLANMTKQHLVITGHISEIIIQKGV